MHGLMRGAATAPWGLCARQNFRMLDSSVAHWLPSPRVFHRMASLTRIKAIASRLLHS